LVDGRIVGEGTLLGGRSPWSPGADAHRRCGGRHGAAEPLCRGVQTARWWPAGRGLDGRGPAKGRARARDPAGPNPLQPGNFATIRRDYARLSRVAALGSHSAANSAGYALAVSLVLAQTNHSRT